MSESETDTKAPMGWTILSNKGSDTETMGSENALENESDLLGSDTETMRELESASVTIESGLQNLSRDSPADTVREETLDDVFNDHLDIVTLGDVREDMVEQEETAANGDLNMHLGTSSSCLYTFIEPERVSTVHQPETVSTAHQPAVEYSSSSENGEPEIVSMQPAVEYSSSSSSESSSENGEPERVSTQPAVVHCYSSSSKIGEPETVSTVHQPAVEYSSSENENEMAGSSPTFMRRRRVRIFSTCTTTSNDEELEVDHHVLQSQEQLEESPSATRPVQARHGTPRRTKARHAKAPPAICICVIKRYGLWLLLGIAIICHFYTIRVKHQNLVNDYQERADNYENDHENLANNYKNVLMQLTVAQKNIADMEYKIAALESEQAYLKWELEGLDVEQDESYVKTVDLDSRLTDLESRMCQRLRPMAWKFYSESVTPTFHYLKDMTLTFINKAIDFVEEK